MILGNVNAAREAVVQIVVLNENKQTRLISAVVDTGYTGDLMLPRNVAESLQLSLREVQEATLGNNTVAEFELYSGLVIWDGKIKRIEMNASQDSALVGMGLIDGFKLEIEGKLGDQVRITALT